MASMKKIFLSSVSRGLEAHRNAVYESLSGIEHVMCIRMEDFGARNRSSLATCMESLADCDALFAVAGPRYGSIEAASGKSYSELEYLTAKQLDIPIFAFLTDADFKLDQSLIESDELRHRQGQFRRILESDRQVDYFSTPEDLRAQAMRALINDRVLGGHDRRGVQTPPAPTGAGVHFVGQEQVLQSARPRRESPAVLLYPFVSNQAGFDTGIVVTNASAGPFYGDPHAGQCRINYFGFTAGGGRAPGPQISGLVAAGGQLVFTLSNGGNLGIVATPGFQGYLVMECGFYPCYGYAFISDLGATRVASSYLAQLVSSPHDAAPQWATGRPVLPT